ncbi:hypothetical protein KDX30_15500 [Pseudomonas sp. CDFA 553]|uniref:hypothetical protein n=1 Tax=Pseudomonas quasicaspiana TaxID=2829821 RepID=UPI001E2E8E31|nr:hypothetical protein [Pseudomonas quasicaspiana]MCD5989308.1 hypothetical protein [Pseudomonas quasicaspiana]
MEIMKEYHILAERNGASNIPHDPDWPKSISYSYENRSLLFSAGKGHGLSGFVLPMDEALDSKWTSIFIELNALWILDFLKKYNLHSLEEVTFALNDAKIPTKIVRA